MRYSQKREHKITLILLIVAMLLTGCGTQASTTKKYELEVEEVEEIAPIEENLLASLIRDIQDEMRIFDVVEHHEALIKRIENEVPADLDSEEMTAQISEIVSSYMDEILRDRIREGLSNIQDPYSDEDVIWVRSQISTDDLYHLITIYEREFYKRELAR